MITTMADGGGARERISTSSRVRVSLVALRDDERGKIAVTGDIHTYMGWSERVIPQSAGATVSVERCVRECACGYIDLKTRAAECSQSESNWGRVIARRQCDRESRGEGKREMCIGRELWRERERERGGWIVGDC